jgi:hypothetical protein
MNIFDKLNILLTESEGVSKVKESDIPIHPEMETKEQGEMAAAEKILKLFQKLKAMSGSSEEEIKDEKPEIPDDIIDPMMKERPTSSKDKTFEKNKLAGWDEEPEEKIKKEVDVDNRKTDIEDDFDDFDYKNNQFGDEDDEEDSTDYDDDDRSEDEKLKDAIDDAIDSLSGDDDDEGEYGEGEGDDDDSGANWGDEGDEGEYGEGGEKEDGKQVGKMGGKPQLGKDGGEKQEGERNSGGSTKDGGERETMSQKQKRLEDLKKSLESDDMEDFNDKMQEIKDATDTPDDGKEIIGGQMETPSDEDFKNDMKKGGFDDKTIDEMTKKKNIDANEDYNEKEMEELKKDVVKGLEKACEKKGGSALASTIVKNSLKQKINNDEWKEMLKIFLKGKSIGSGNMSYSNKGIKWGNKNHLWRDAVLPTDGPSKGTIQTINCFIDFSGSVDKNLVREFLEKVIDMCVKLKYTKVNVYGFGNRIVEPRVIDKKLLNKGTDVLLSDTWNFIENQYPGGGTENFSDVANTINKIKQKDKKAVFLIFGDGYWEDQTLGPKCLKYEIMNTKYLDDICILAYYRGTPDRRFAGVINILRDIVGIKHIITSKASSIHD